ncbi:MAG: sigma-70 family RNA polymerase sigma factor [Myxococcota bacterium]|nr:sigma-70 family RNA polymerase sigma factor [Myxococcota bacterium]
MTETVPVTPDEPLTFGQALAAEMGHLERMARYYTSDAVDAEDLIQDTVLLALRFSDSYQAGSNLRAWLQRVMRNRHVSILRRKNLESRVLKAEAYHAVPEWSIGEMSRKTTRIKGRTDLSTGLSAPLMRAIGRLRPEFREVLLICDVEGLSYADAAERVGRPIGTIMSRLHRGRRALRIQIGHSRHLEAA